MDPTQDEWAVKEIEMLAQTYQLTLTGGSDFQGMYEGSVNTLGSRTTPPEFMERLYQQKAPIR